MKTEILVLTSGTITSGVIDLYDDIPLSLNYNIADIRTPDKRNADYSKTITVPGTDNNNQLLAHIFEIGTDRLFNPNKKTNAAIMVDHTSVMNGILRLRDISTLRDNKIEYNLEFKGRIDDLFTAIKDLELTDIDWSDLDHTYTKTNIINSWSATVGTGYVYPFIDYGVGTTAPNNKEVISFRPATYAKDIWDRIFAVAGFQYSSAFLTSNFFKRLIIPCTGERFIRSQSQVANNIFRASVSTNQTITLVGVVPITNDHIRFSDDTTAPNSDAGNVWNTAIWEFTCVEPGVYTFNSSVVFHFETNVAGTFSGYTRILKNSLPAAISSYFSSTTNPFNLITEVTSTCAYTAYLNTGDRIQAGYFNVGYSNAGGPGFTTQNNYIKTGSYFYSSLDASYSFNSSIDYSTAVPQLLKMEDFLMAIIKLFNLYFEYDKDIPNKIYIEPRNDFYNSTIDDWSEKLDESQPLIIEPMGALDAKRYIFKYKPDQDWLNETYQASYHQIKDESYGLKIKDVDNDFLRNDNVLESIFSPTPQYSDLGSDRVYPRIIKIDDSSNAISPVNSNLRILYYSGLLSCNAWIFWDHYDATGLPGIYSQYAYCGHIDSPSSGTIDLSWGVPKVVYYIPPWNATYPDANLYNVYWKKFIEEITDKNSSIVTGWFHLTPADIAVLDFRHIYQFRWQGMLQNYRLNKIYDYNPVKESLTKCEFIKTKEAVPFVPRNLLMLGKAVSAIDQGPLNHITPIPPVGHKEGLVTAGNQVGSNVTSGIIILGTGNIVYEGAKNITIIQSSGNIVIHDNTTIIQSSGVTTTGPNQLWIYNQLVTSGDIYDLTHCCVEHTVAEMQALAGADLLNCCLTYKILDPEGTTDPLVIMASSGSVLNDYGEQIRAGLAYNVGYDLALDQITHVFDERENNLIYNPSGTNRSGNCLTDFPLNSDNYYNNKGSGFGITLVSSGNCFIVNNDLGTYATILLDGSGGATYLQNSTFNGGTIVNIAASNISNLKAGDATTISAISGSIINYLEVRESSVITIDASTITSCVCDYSTTLILTSGTLSTSHILGGLTITFPVGSWTGSISKVDGTSSFETTIDVNGFTGTFDFIISGDDFSFCGVIRFTTSGSGATINALKDANLSNQIPVAFKRFYGTSDTVTFVHNAVDIFNLGAVNVVLNSDKDWVDYMILPNAGSPIAYEIMHANY